MSHLKKLTIAQRVGYVIIGLAFILCAVMIADVALDLFKPGYAVCQCR